MLLLSLIRSVSCSCIQELMNNFAYIFTCAHCLKLDTMLLIYPQLVSKDLKVIWFIYLPSQEHSVATVSGCGYSKGMICE